MSVVIIGVGRYAREVLEIVTAITEVYVIEKPGEHIQKFVEEAKGLEKVKFVFESATDVETWREKVNLSEVEAVISFLKLESTLEVAKLLREFFNYEGEIIYVAKERPENEELQKLKVDTVSIPNVLRVIFKNLLIGKGIIRYPVGIGLEKGEIVEITLTEYSPLVYKRLRDIKIRKARVALVYRNGKLLLPRSNLRLQSGDRLLVVGEPSSVNVFIHTATEGISDFPLNWGSAGVYCSGNEKEFNYLKEKVKVREWLEDCEKIQEIENLGLIVLEKKESGFLKKGSVDRAFEEFSVPSFHLKGTYPYEKVLASANTDAREVLLSTAVDIAVQFGSKLFILYVKPFEKMISEKEKEVIEGLKSFAERVRKITKINLELVIREGNPVRETLKFMDEESFNLLLIGYKVGRTTKLFSPYSPHLIARKSKLSTLLVPEVVLEQ